jgi:hypothetical protein
MRRFSSLFLAVLTSLLLGCLVASSASATIITDGSGKQLGVGTVIKAESKSFPLFHWTFVPDRILCGKSTLEAKITNAGGAASTVEAQVQSLTFSECGENDCPVVTLKGGELVFHTGDASSNNNATITSTGLELTSQCFGVHCTWGTGATDLGSLKAGTPGEIWVSAFYPRFGGSSGFLCPSTQRWTGVYKVTSPSSISVD